MWFIRKINRIINYLILKSNKVNYNRFPIFKGLVKIINEGQITIKDNVYINSGKNYNIIGGDIRTAFIVLKTGKLEIGENSGISNSTFVCAKKITLEKNVFIGGSCKIYDTDFHPLVSSDRIINNENTSKIINKKITIKEGAFIGAHSIILKGVTIGKNSVIGAGSVVYTSVPDNEIWGGNPAKFIRKNFLVRDEIL